MRSFGLAFCSLALVATADAHEKWFFDASRFPLDATSVAQPRTLAFIAAVVLITAALGLVWRARRRAFLPGPEQLGASENRRAAIFGLIPAILALHVAIPLLVGGVTGHLFSPDVHLAGWSRYWFGVLETGVALALFYGGLTRLAAVAMAALWLTGIFLFGLEPMLDNALYLGLAAFFFCCGRGPVSVDRMLFPKFEPSPELMRTGLACARIGLGVSLTVVAFTEKLANLPLAVAFLQENHLNFTATLGIGMSNELFALFAGAVELLAGLMILFNIFPREIAIVAWLPINMTLTVFNWTELIGHLPIYGILALLVIWTPSEENLNLWVRGLREGPLGLSSEPHL